MDDTSLFQDDDLVYVDPAAKAVLGKVEFDANGNPKTHPYPKGDAGGKHSWRMLCPWGRYSSMKRAFRLEGRVREEKAQATLDDVLPKLLNDTL